jgi:hypothetical protein
VRKDNTPETHPSREHRYAHRLFLHVHPGVAINSVVSIRAAAVAEPSCGQNEVGEPEG